MHCHYDECHAECHVLYTIVLNVITLSVVMVSVIALQLTLPSRIKIFFLMKALNTAHDKTGHKTLFVTGLETIVNLFSL
jgi:hypothetical protein